MEAAVFEKQNIQETVNELKSDAVKGLTDGEAFRRLQQNGRNEMKAARKKTKIQLFLEQLKDPLIYILLIAAVVSVFLGELSDAVIIGTVVVVNIYNAVDLFVIPSLEENLPNMIMEAMACGVPCVGFNVGGIPEMIDHLHNGYVARYKSSEDFANGIHWILTDPEYDELSAQACRKVLGNYSESIIAKKYTDLYNKVTGKYA